MEAHIRHPKCSHFFSIWGQSLETVGTNLHFNLWQFVFLTRNKKASGFMYTNAFLCRKTTVVIVWQGKESASILDIALSLSKIVVVVHGMSWGTATNPSLTRLNRTPSVLLATFNQTITSKNTACIDSLSLSLPTTMGINRNIAMSTNTGNCPLIWMKEEGSNP